jgi:dTDP-4-amino-4,6-dideoxygalactose transaminase
MFSFLNSSAYGLKPWAIGRRDKLMRFLRSKNIESAFHYLPLHLAPMGRQFGYQEGDCPITEEISGRLLRLPFHNRITEDDQNRVLSTISAFCAELT